MTINRLNQGTTNQVLVKAISGQTTNLLELQDSSGNVVSSIGPTGALGGTVSQPQGLVHINTTSFSAVSSFSLPDNTFSSTYDNYRLIIDLSASTSTTLRLRYRASGVDNSSSIYTFGGYFGGVSTALTRINTLNAAQFDLASSISGSLSFVADILQPFGTGSSNKRMLCNYFIGSSADNFNVGLTFGSSSSQDSLSFITTAGTITGKYYVYGYNE
jgi:hypothetical protein